MAELAARLAVSFAPGPWLNMQPVATRFIFRGAAEAQSAAGNAFGVSLPGAACRASTGGSRAALWLGPDEWLLLAPDGEGAAIATDVARALGDRPHSLVDVSHRQVAFAVTGPNAERLLESQCPLPLDLEAFPVGMCTRTVFAKAEIVLWRTAADTFHVEVWRSFSGYVVALLSEVAREM